jgi:hypothetical protein
MGGVGKLREDEISQKWKVFLLHTLQQLPWTPKSQNKWKTVINGRSSFPIYSFYFYDRRIAFY